MSDKFGRQKSNRWVKADKPSYGDWGDDDNSNDEEEIYGDEDSAHDVNSNELKPFEHEKQASNRNVNMNNHQNAEEAEPRSTNLVLSIDQRKDINFDSSDEEEIISLPKVVEGFETNNDYNDIETNQNKRSSSSLISRNKGLKLNQSLTSESLELQPPTPTYNTHQQQYSVSSDPQTPLSETSFQSDNSIQNEPEHLSIKPSAYIPEEIKEEEESVPNEIQKENTIKQPNSNLVLSIDDQNYSNSDDSDHNDWKRTDSRPDIDSFLNDLASSSGDAKSTEILPPLDHDSSLPEFKKTSSSRFDDTQTEADDTIAPLSVQRESHEQYVNNIARRKSSIRKPISINSDSGDYSNIVSGYGDEEEKDSKSEDEKASRSFEPPQLKEMQGSSGSLSTGKFSIESNQTGYSKPPFPGIDKDESRRVSQSTLNFGNWNPDTDSYRNQFVNANDTESTLNYDPSKGNYERFTNSNASIKEDDQISESSSLSVPETIDATLPNIEENISDQEEENNERGSMDHTIHTNGSSILNDNFYSKPVFREEKLTPAPSKESLPHPTAKSAQSQRYSSLLPPTENERRASDSSDINESNTTISSSLSPQPKTSRSVSHNNSILNSVSDFTPQKYPVTNWKDIIAKGQPKDRILLFREALIKEYEYDTGLQNWLIHSLKQTESNQNQIHIGRIASAAYQNAPHNDLRRHASLRSRVNIVKDKVEGTGSSASQFGKKLFSRSKKFIRSDK